MKRVKGWFVLAGLVVASVVLLTVGRKSKVERLQALLREFQTC